MTVVNHYKFPDGEKVTVKMLRDALSHYPQDLEIRIDDADTGMYLKIEEIELHKPDDILENPKVTLGGWYWP